MGCMRNSECSESFMVCRHLLNTDKTVANMFRSLRTKCKSIVFCLDKDLQVHVHVHLYTI